MTNENVLWAKEKISIAGQSQRSLAKLLGIQFTLISHMFNGSRRMPLDEAVKWAKILNVTLDEIAFRFSQDGEPYKVTDAHAYGLKSRHLEVKRDLTFEELCS